MARPSNFTVELPVYASAEWEGNTLKNKDSAAPLWSGAGAPPQVGAYIRIAGSKKELATVLGYHVIDGWLMVWVHAHDQNREGDLAGTEIAKDV